jgi:hypothetical protein
MARLEISAMADKALLIEFKFFLLAGVQKVSIIV